MAESHERRVLGTEFRTYIELSYGAALDQTRLLTAQDVLHQIT